ncbi:hypothetical protein C9374_007758 [Naegleria lovaniensis]|uniref:Uncharacterized protein n=1 Tax=Naegleria lovaniensis TaxID=51637 RepID=A0AA88KH18_NAELO|nr:uncharacterized protein C9374_007758 [Naegleria lovaniensis]KAG2379120.1 hypothetical protein C9374_007758 [Naegleria lovaniensis]
MISNKKNEKIRILGGNHVESIPSLESSKKRQLLDYLTDDYEEMVLVHETEEIRPCNDKLNWEPSFKLRKLDENDEMEYFVNDKNDENDENSHLLDLKSHPQVHELEESDESSAKGENQRNARK